MAEDETLRLRRGFAGLWATLHLGVALTLSAAPSAFAQRAQENAVASADDAFGSVVGQEKIGIYSDTNIRGFDPVRAGNVRIDGVFFDQQATVSMRVRAGSRIRVGVAALDYPFPAPTGIVDIQLRSAAREPGASLQIGRNIFGGQLVEFDTHGSLLDDRLTVTAGVNYQHDQASDGSDRKNYGIGAIPRFRLDSGEVTLLLGHFSTRNDASRIVVTAPGAFIPAPPPARRYLGQEWARGASDNSTLGAIWRQSLGDNWLLRSGVFYSRQFKRRAYSELFVVSDPSGLARHSIVADPSQNATSYSGETQLIWRHDGEALSSRVLFTVRARDKRLESGGSDRRDLGSVQLGEPDPEVEPTFVFGPTDKTHIRQTTAAVGYMVRVPAMGQLNAGLQKTFYRASFQRLGHETATSDDPWLYNATLVLTPSDRRWIYASYVRGLEDSGVAPENAANRNETLPAARTTQMEAGFRLKAGTLTLLTSAFQIEKPYFSFDATQRFTQVGVERHRGIEASIAGAVSPRLTVLAGAVLMRPTVSGEALTLGLVGPRPVGVPSAVLRLDAEYQTNLKGLSLTAAVARTGRRAASARPYVVLGGDQLFAPAFTTLDIGARYRFRLSGRAVTARATLSNVFDARSWNIVSGNAYQISDTRRWAVFLLTDF